MVEGGSVTNTVGSRNTPQDVPNWWDQNEVEDTDDSDTDSVAGSVRQEDTVSVVDDPADVAMPRAPTLRHAFRNMDDVDVERIFSLRASVTRCRVSCTALSERNEDGSGGDYGEC